MPQNFTKTIIIFTIGVLIGLPSGYALKKSPESATKEIRQGGYRFINPLLECEIPDASKISKELPVFKSKIQNLISKTRKNKEEVAVYFRDLNNGIWFGINESALFLPASLMKVPVMMSFYKESETNPDILKKIIKYTPDPEEAANPSQNIKPSELIILNKSYSVKELIERMVTYSDNEALFLLTRNFPENIIFKVYNDLNLVPSTALKNDKGNISVSVSSYASLFRILFNGSYLNKQNSEYALSLLSKTNFYEGLVAGLPKNIVISHKFGERTVNDGTANPPRQIHDCGIIYHPVKPYLLCVMTKGEDYKHLESIIQEISRETFESVSSEMR